MSDQLKLFDGLPKINPNIKGLTEADAERIKRAEPRAFYSFGSFTPEDEEDDRYE